MVTSEAQGTADMSSDLWMPPTSADPCWPSAVPGAMHSGQQWMLKGKESVGAISDCCGLCEQYRKLLFLTTGL